MSGPGRPRMTAAQPHARPGFLANIGRHLTIWREAWRVENGRPKRDLKRGEREFLPAAIEIMEHPASPVGRALIWSLCAFFTIAVAWSIVGKIDIVAVAQGKVVPQGRTKVVQPLEIGVVRAIHVQDGDHVKAGQPLIDLDPTDASADHERLDRERAARALDVARLDCCWGRPGRATFRSGRRVRPAAGRVGAPPARFAMAGAHRQARHARRRDRAPQGRATRRRDRNRALQGDHAVAARPQRQPGRAGPQGLTSRLRASEVQQQLIEAEKGLLAAVDKRLQADAALRSAEQQRRQTERESESTWRKERAEAIEKGAAAEQEILKAKKRRDLQRLVSPIDGTVTNLAAWTVGGVVKPGDTLLNVVPLSATPEIEAMVLNKDVGFVRAGQR